MLNDIGNHCKMILTKKNLSKIIINYEKVIIDKRDIEAICSKYTLLEDFRKTNIDLYNKLCRLKLLDFFTLRMKRKNVRWTYNSVKDTIDKYEYIHELIKGNWGAYQFCKRYFPFLLKNLKRKDRSKIRLGKTLSQETKDKISLSVRGNKNAKKH